MRSFWAQKLINMLLIKGKKKVLLKVFFNLMVFFKNASFARNFTEKDTESVKAAKVGAAERKRVRKNHFAAQRYFFKKLRLFRSQLKKSLRGKLQVKLPKSVAGGLSLNKVAKIPALLNSPFGVRSRLYSFLKKNLPEHYSSRLWFRHLVKKTDANITTRKLYLHFYRHQHLRREFFKISDSVLPAKLNISGEHGARGYFEQLTNNVYKVESLDSEANISTCRAFAPSISHRVFSMGDRYGAVRFYWFFKAMESARSSVFIQKRYIRRGVFYFVKLIPWWRQYTLVLRRLKRALRATDEFNRIDGVNLEDKLKVEFLAAINGDESKSQLLLGKAETVSLLCEGRLKVHFRWKWR